ncbi:TraC family protein [Herbaspirillum sp. RV1423]|uniref:TraG/VirB4 family ATPase n=1 Tax=Herbaspirillum sp. RV1423 TaxID=1443993 RepID=UPI0004AECD50|nr:TraC family protein [Herbaspirillum sp. RV1423]
MQLRNPLNQRFKLASNFVNLESYVADTNLMMATPEKSPQFIGRTYEMSPLSGGGSEVPTLVKNVFKMAKDNSLVQFTLVSYPDYDTPHIFAQGKVHGGEMITELVQRQAHLMHKALTPDCLEGIPAINNKTLLITFQTPVKKASDEVLEDEMTAQNEFVAGLRSCGFLDARPVSPELLAAIYRQLANIYKPRPSVELDPLLPLRNQIFGGDDEFDFTHREYALINDVYCGAVVPKRLPRKPTNALMNLVIGAPLLDGKIAEGGGGIRPKTPYILSTTVRVANQSQESTRVERALNSRSKNGGKAPFALGSEDSQQVVNDLAYLQKACSDGQNKYTYSSLVAFAFGKTKQEMIETRTTLMNTMNYLQFDARPVRWLIGQRFVQTLPMNFSPLIAKKLVSEAIMPASSAAYLLPIYSDYRGNANLRSNHTGMALMTERGESFFWDIFRTNTNKNGVLAGGSGSGKSFAAQEMIVCSVAEGTPVYYFDNGNSGKKTAEFIDGEVNEFNLRSSNIPSLNPFTPLNQEAFDEQKELITAIGLKMSFFEEEIESGARIAMSEAVAAAWLKRQNKADYNTVLDCLESIKNNSAQDQMKSEVVVAATNLIPRLKNFLESPARGRFFNGTGTLDPQKLFVVYEMSGLDGDDHLKQCVLFLVMNMLLEVVKKRPGRKLILLDEVMDLLRDPGAAWVVQQIYRKARKDEGSIWVLTQSPRDLKGFATGDIILSQSSWKVILRQEKEEVDKIIAEKVLSSFADDGFFNRSIKDVKTVKGVYSGLLICGEQTYERCRLYVDPFTRVLFSTDGEERSEIFRMMKMGMTAVDAIEKLTGDKSRSRSKWLQEIIQTLRTTDGLSDQQIHTELKAAIDEKAYF